MGNLQIAGRVADKFLLGHSKTMGQGRPANRPLPGSGLSNARLKMLKVIMLRFSS